MPAIRSFVAVEIDETARRDLARLLDQLRRPGADVKWVAPSNLHLTLKFLGDVQAKDVPAVSEALRRGLAGSGGPFVLGLEGVGAFPASGDPRVVWVGVTRGREALAGLAARVEASLGPLGFPQETRGFSPHLSLGRCRSARNAAGLVAALGAQRAYRGPEVRVERVVLFSSELRPAGPVYTPLETFAL